MKQNFDEIISREGTYSYKYDLRKKMFGTDDVYPMWVADTEFKAPEFILEAIQRRLNHGILGYTITDNDYYTSIINWLWKKHNWQVQKNSIKYSPGVVPSLFASVLAFTEPGDKVIIQTPVYHPFYFAVQETGRQLVKNSLILKEGRYAMDLEDLKSKIDKHTKLIFLCNPHNPTGNVWKKHELLELCEICLKNNIIIISDEIHSDIVYKPNVHIPVATLSEEISNNTVTLMAPSKTFNIAGINSSFMVSSNEKLLKKINFYFEGLHIGPNIFAIEATKAAYNYGEDWLDNLIKYFEKNTDTVRKFLKSELNKIDLIEPEGTFLLWLDFRKFNLKRKELNDLMVLKAKLGLSDGAIFGAEGNGFLRLNIGCPAEKLNEALNSMCNVFKNL